MLALKEHIYLHKQCSMFLTKISKCQHLRNKIKHFKEGLQVLSVSRSIAVGLRSPHKQTPTNAESISAADAA